MARHPDNEVVPGMLIFRIESSVMYFNAEYIRQAVLTQVRARESLRVAIGDLSSSPYVDVSGARMLSKLKDELSPAASSFASPRRAPTCAICCALRV